MDLKINNPTNFKSGITPKILHIEKNIIPKQIENYFRNLPTKDFGSFYNIDFKDNNAMALASKLCADIFNNLRKLFDYRNGYSGQTLTSPQDLYVYNKEDSFIYDNHEFFALAGDGRIEPNKPFFYIGTVFMPNHIKDIESINAITEKTFEQQRTSSSHFLNVFIHEWLHAISYKLIKNYSDNHNKDYTSLYHIYSSMQLTEREKEITSDIIGNYPASLSYGAYPELFAESWTKFICDSLSEDCKTFKKNPLDVMRATPKEFQEILKKASLIKK